MLQRIEINYKDIKDRMTKLNGSTHYIQNILADSSEHLSFVQNGGKLFSGTIPSMNRETKHLWNSSFAALNNEIHFDHLTYTVKWCFKDCQMSSGFFVSTDPLVFQDLC